MTLHEILAVRDRYAAFMELATLYAESDEAMREALIDGWDYDVEWGYGDWRRLACSVGETYGPERKVRAFLVAEALASKQSLLDERDRIVGLAVVYQSAVAAGLDADQVLLESARISPPTVMERLERFVARRDGDKSLAAFCLIRVTNADGEIEIHAAPRP